MIDRSLFKVLTRLLWKNVYTKVKHELNKEDFNEYRIQSVVKFYSDINFFD